MLFDPTTFKALRLLLAALVLLAAVNVASVAAAIAVRAWRGSVVC